MAGILVSSNHVIFSSLQEVKLPSPDLLSISMAAWPVLLFGQAKLRVRK